MPTGTEKILDRLDRLIVRCHLHDGDPRLPVWIDPVLEVAVVRRWFLPEPCSAVTVLLGADAAIMLNKDLMEPDRSADDRHAKAHEFGHVEEGHQGYQIMWRATWSRGTAFEQYLRTREERECELIAAYLLVSYPALEAMCDCEPGYISSVLDVPEHLVLLRLELRSRYGR